MLSKIKKVAFILGLAVFCAAGQAEAQNLVRGHEEVSGPSAGHAHNINAEPQAMGSVGSAKHDADQTAQRCKQYSNTKDPVSRKAKGCDKIIEH